MARGVVVLRREMARAWLAGGTDGRGAGCSAAQRSGSGRRGVRWSASSVTRGGALLASHPLLHTRVWNQHADGRRAHDGALASSLRLAVDTVSWRALASLLGRSTMGLGDRSQPGLETY